VTMEEARRTSCFAVRLNPSGVPGQVAAAAVAALYNELCAYPKPGLVSLVDNGSHDDMDARTFMLSIISLRGYFEEVTRGAMGGSGFHDLRILGLQAESRMLKATGNINTHRGAIFSLGLLAASVAHLSTTRSLEKGMLGQVVPRLWSKELLLIRPSCARLSHGRIVAERYAMPGAREEAAAGFPHVFAVGLPALQDCLLRGICFHDATIQAFFSLMAVLPDSNLLFRGGKEGLLYAQRAARSFLDGGGVYRKDWQERALQIHRQLVARRLSPGGTADLLTASLFVHTVTFGGVEG